MITHASVSTSLELQTCQRYHCNHHDQAISVCWLHCLSVLEARVGLHRPSSPTAVFDFQAAAGRRQTLPTLIVGLNLLKEQNKQKKAEICMHQHLLQQAYKASDILVDGIQALISFRPCPMRQAWSCHFDVRRYHGDVVSFAYITARSWSCFATPHWPLSD